MLLPLHSLNLPDGPLQADNPHLLHLPSRDRQYFYCNNRFAACPELARMADAWFAASLRRRLQQQAQAQEPYAAASLHSQGGAYPGYILLLECPPAHLDVNSEPDKAVAIFRHPSTVRALLAQLLHKVWGSGGANSSGAQPGGLDCADLVGGTKRARGSGGGMSTGHGASSG